jgi:hypothetical protein
LEEDEEDEEDEEWYLFANSKAVATMTSMIVENVVVAGNQPPRR